MEPEELAEVVESEAVKNFRSAQAIYANLEAQYNRPQVFTDKAKCAGLPLEWFVIVQPDKRPTATNDMNNRKNLKRGLATCNGCPLLYNGECYDQAEPIDLDWTIRGGEIPLMWDQVKDRVRRPGGRPAGVKVGHCLLNHDLRLPDAKATNGSCRICAQANRRENWQSRQEALGRQVAASGIRCRNGHDLTPAGSQLSSGRCKACSQANSRRSHAKMREQQQARLAQRQLAGVE
jgi:hypothetical protein